MRTPRILAALALGLTGLAATPALADEKSVPETVKITVDLDASADEIYASIRSQVWEACKPERSSHHMAARMKARRKCQKAMISDVVEALEAPEVTRLAEADRMCLPS
ncbi:MAG: UrcA family protein [Henriciella sp.]